jgi:AcrR family transcriptional regulator
MSEDGRTRRARVQRTERRAQILARALEVFASKGYHRTSISDLVAAAGVARGTFYLYFQSKEAIFLELVDGLLKHLGANVVGIAMDDSAPAPLIQLHGTVVRILQTLANNRELTKIILREAVGLDPEVENRLGAFYGNLRSYVSMSLEQGQTLGIVRSNIDLNVAASCILGGIRQVVDRYVIADGDRAFDAGDVASAVLDVYLNGVWRQAPS